MARLHASLPSSASIQAKLFRGPNMPAAPAVSCLHGMAAVYQGPPSIHSFIPCAVFPLPRLLPVLLLLLLLLSLLLFRTCELGTSTAISGSGRDKLGRK